MAKPSTELKRAVGPWGAIWMGLGSILGTGVFVSLGIGAEIIGSGLLLAVTLAALIAIANGLSSAQLAAAHPVSGGTYEYGHKFIGPKAGLVAGWMFLLAKSASAGTAALGFSGYVFHSIGVDASKMAKVSLALVLVAVLTALVSSGIQRSNRANQIIVALTLTTLACFVVFGWLSVDLALVSERIGPKTWIEAFESPYALLNATGLMFVAYTGYGRIATLGEEVLEPSKTIPKAIIGALGLTMVLYIGVAATALATVGAAAFADTTASISAPLEVVAHSFNYSFVAPVVAFGAITAMVGVLLNLILGLSRVLLAMARRGEAPRFLEEVDVATQSPSKAVWVMGCNVAAIVLVGDFKTTWSFSAFSVLVYYGITNWAALRLPEENQRFPRAISYFGLIACFGLVPFISLKIALVTAALLAIGLGLSSLIRRTH